MSTNPSFKTRLMAALHHEVSAVDLEAYRSAGAATYGLLEEIGDAFDPAAASTAQRVSVLCGWVAFALQSAGDALVAADYDTDPATVGFVPEVTRRQAMSFYSEVGDWVSAAREVSANPQFRPAAQLPTRWPAWAELEPCPTAHLAAMVDTVQRLSERVLLLVKVDGHNVYGEAEGPIRQLLARGDTRRDQATGLWRSGSRSAEIHRSIEDQVKEAIAAYFLAGQLMAMPELAGHLGPDLAATTAGDGVAAGSAGFDPWCLTDPASRSRWQGDPAARRAIDMLWAYDPDPTRTVAVQAEIDAALDQGKIAHDGLGNFYCCPWSAIFGVVDPVSIGGKRLRRGQQFTFDVSAEEVPEGGPFKREILVADFRPTDEVDYCNPDQRH